MDFLTLKRYHILKGSAFKAFSFHTINASFTGKSPIMSFESALLWVKSICSLVMRASWVYCIVLGAKRARHVCLLPSQSGCRTQVSHLCLPTHLPWVPLGFSAAIDLLKHYLRWFWRVNEKLRLIFGWVPGLIIANYKFLSGCNLKNRA